MNGALRVLKVPVPNSPHFGLQVQGHLVECLQFNAQIFKDSNILVSGNQPQMKIAVFIWILVIEDEATETHEFVMVQTGEDFPMLNGEIRYIDSALVPIPTGDIEMHLFHAGRNDAMHDELAAKIEADKRDEQ